MPGGPRLPFSGAYSPWGFFKPILCPEPVLSRNELALIRTNPPKRVYDRELNISGLSPEMFIPGSQGMTPQRLPTLRLRL